MVVLTGDDDDNLEKLAMDSGVNYVCISIVFMIVKKP